ncbi:MAG: hypothetical protein OXF57_07475, partial [Rhodospirillaceae bacterium]|nr:hypothetical protein [Rhodospirillaceae bacterium]
AQLLELGRSDRGLDPRDRLRRRVVLAEIPERRERKAGGLAGELEPAAVWYLGKDNATPEAVARIESAIGPAEFEKLCAADMPAWMAKAFADAGAPAHG